MEILKPSCRKDASPARRGRRLFCQLGPRAYELSRRKECALRRLRDAFSGETFAARFSPQALPNIVKAHRSPVCRELAGVDMALQRNKAVNLKLAGDRVSGILIAPGETFSFWRLVGEPAAKKGYLPGLVIEGTALKSGVGGGLCQLANLIHWLVLNSPLTVTELHHHTDALFPDAARRVPFGTGTGIYYNYIDYRFRNTTDQTVQLLVWQAEGDLCGELRSLRPFPFRYRLEETDSRYVREGENYYRCSEVWRLTLDEQRREVGRELLLKNHSRVMYSPALIPPEELCDAPEAEPCR